MPVGPRLELCRRQGNVVYLPAAHSHEGRRRVRPIENSQESIYEPAVGLSVGAAAVPCYDSMLMVGG